MKKLYFSLFSVFAGLSSYAQFTQANHAPAAGDTWSTYQCDSTGVVPGTPGTGKLWNFASIPTRSAIVVNYAASASSGNAAYASANVSVSASNNNTWFYGSGVSQLDFYGGSFSLNGIAGERIFTSPALAANYPMSLNQPMTSVTGGSINVTSPLSSSGSFSGSANVVADATGTMVLPGTLGTFTSVTRMVYSLNTNFTVSVFGSPVNGTLTETFHHYYQSGIKAPIFSISSATATIPSFTTASQTIVTRNKDAVGTSTTGSTVGLSEQVLTEVNVFPNPSSGFVNFAVNVSKAATVAVYDITGKQVEKLILSEGTARLDVSGYTSGMYIYSVSDSKGKVLKTGKLAVSH